MQHYAERDIWGDLRPGTEIPSGLEENLRFTSYRYDPVIGKYFAQARFYDSANGRMLSKDPVKRSLNSYRYCDNDPADYVDPTGEIAHILWGIGLGGAFGFGGGFLSSAVSQKASGGEIDWKEALGSGINGLITGATQGGLLASGAGIPAALFANTLAGTAGSAAEQYIGSGKIDARKSITSGLNNAVSNAIYGTRPLGSMKEAFGRGVGAGAATSALNYISDTLGEKTLHSRMGMGLLSGMTGAAFSPYNFLRNPRRGCGSPSPFVPSLGYGSARGYQYDLPKIENGSQSQSKRFSFKDLLLEMVIGGVTGGLSSAAFYGAGKGIERLIDGLRPSKGSTGVLDNANYAQKTYSNTFSVEGRKKYSDLAGEPIKTIDDLVNAINFGKVNVADLPVEYIVRDRNILILNTRTSQALTQAGIPRSQWNAIDRTGEALFEELLTGQLSRNKLTSEGISTVRPSGGQ